MKKLMFALAATATMCTFAATEKNATEEKKTTETAKPAELAESSAPILWGFGNYGFYSGYQLYGSIVNTEPTLQGYGELNANLPWSVGNMDDLGFFGVGLWSNSDLTGKRNAKYRRAFNEFDFNIHWQKTFYFDDDKTWGLTYRTYVVWYYYPITNNRHPVNPVTFDWDHYVELTNPYVIPYVNYVHEWLKSYGNLLQFGVKKPFQITDELSLTPFIEFVWRDNHYGWCFSNYGMDENYVMQSAGLATMKLELDATYQITSWFGIFAKVAYCQNLDPHMRESARFVASSMCADDMAYGKYNEFCWGGVGVCFNF